jgi:hypothetical protein
MTKAEVISLINTNIATGGNITAAEHKAVELAIVDLIGLETVAYGRIGAIDVNSGQTSWDTTGAFTSAVKIGSGTLTQIRVTFASGLLSSTDFKVRIDVESAGSSITLDNDILPILFRKNGSSTTTFDLILEENPGAGIQTIYVHAEVIQL